MYSASNLADWLERKSFQGGMGDPPGYEEEEIKGEIALSCRFMLDTEPFRVNGPIPNEESRISIHPPLVSALKLIGEALPDLRERQNVSAFMSICPDRYRKMSPARQRRWLERMWRLPRPC
jgi:hypothetical protein